MTWEIVVGISVLFGFIVAVVTPLVKLNTSITKLDCTMEEINKHLENSDKQTIENSRRIENHETRITVLEEKKGK